MYFHSCLKETSLCFKTTSRFVDLDRSKSSCTFLTPLLRLSCPLRTPPPPHTHTHPFVPIIFHCVSYKNYDGGPKRVREQGHLYKAVVQLSKKLVGGEEQSGIHVSYEKSHTAAKQNCDINIFFTIGNSQQSPFFWRSASPIHTCIKI